MKVHEKQGDKVKQQLVEGATAAAAGEHEDKKLREGEVVEIEMWNNIGKGGSKKGGYATLHDEDEGKEEYVTNFMHECLLDDGSIDPFSPNIPMSELGREVTSSAARCRHSSGEAKANHKEGDSSSETEAHVPHGLEPFGGAYCSCISGRNLVYVCAICSSLSSVLLGYDVGVMSGAKEFMSPDLNLSAIQEESVVGSLNIVAAFGGLVAGRFADIIGRKRTIGLSCCIFLAGALMCTFSFRFWSMLLGRVVTGIGVGCAMVIAPVYISELAPASIRGMLVSMTDISINLGILMGYATSLLCDQYIEDQSLKWRAMLAIGMLPPVFILACLLLMPDSPRWLLSQGRVKEGFSALWRTFGTEKEAQTEFDAINRSIQGHSRSTTWREVLFPRSGAIRRALMIGLGLGIWQQASGSEAAVYYSPEVLRKAGWEGQQLLIGNMAVGTSKLLGEVIAFFFLDRVGRRPLLLLSAITQTVTLFGIAAAFGFEWNAMTILVWLGAFMLCFSLGLGPVTFVMASEVFPLAVRSKAMSLVIFVNRLMSGLIALSYESIADFLSPEGSFAMFGVLSAISVGFYYTLPETKGKTLEQIQTELDAEEWVEVHDHDHGHPHHHHHHRHGSDDQGQDLGPVSTAGDLI